MTCSQSCRSLHFLLTNTDAHSDSGHQSFSILCNKTFFLNNLKLHTRFDTIVSAMPVLHIVRACVCQLCGMWVWLAIRLSQVRSSCPAPFYCWNWSWTIIYSHSHSFLLKEGQLSVTGKTPLQALLYLLDGSTLPSPLDNQLGKNLNADSAE